MEFTTPTSSSIRPPPSPDSLLSRACLALVRSKEFGTATSTSGHSISDQISLQADANTANAKDLIEATSEKSLQAEIEKGHLISGATGKQIAQMPEVAAVLKSALLKVNVSPDPRQVIRTLLPVLLMSPHISAMLQTRPPSTWSPTSLKYDPTNLLFAASVELQSQANPPSPPR
jgi:hypothetical protein